MENKEYDTVLWFTSWRFTNVYYFPFLSTALELQQYNKVLSWNLPEQHKSFQHHQHIYAN